MTPFEPAPNILSTRPVVRRPATVIPATNGSDELDGEGARVMLQFLPSGSCLALALESPVILGRGGEQRFEPVIDLSEYKALQHGVSRRHCLLRRQDRHVTVCDLNSTNGTYLNNLLLPPESDYLVRSGDRLILGTLHVRVTFDTPS